MKNKVQIKCIRGSIDIWIIYMIDDDDDHKLHKICVK